MRRAVSLLLSALVAGGVALGAAPAAWAHNVLISSDPKDGAELATGPREVTLTFDQPVQAGERFNTLTVTSADGTRWEDQAEPTVRDNSVIFPVRELGPAGEYTLGYRVLSADGHPVSGSLKFTTTTAAQGTPVPASESATPEASGEDSGGGVPVWVWIVGAVVLLGGGVFFALRGGGDGADR
ncbi:copper resistance CopC family protein [Actinosynnema pretiosum]|uniref:Copper resistance protein CopC n=1 Tax=Actinosynnema pretiosum TaxID=42197 RepID=A0A290YYU3_9PSEU|nr:copper resistance CopC family protein [Actinosynnema pretiosum]ATE51903.1 copper resistance protein CopC [Actinosynnema pretiosum]